MNEEKTLIEKLQQLERVKLYDLLCDASIWNSVDVNYHLPHVERLWCQLGKYRLHLHFIHACEKGESLMHPHPWSSVIHVLEGEYEMGIGFGEGIDTPEVFSTIVSQGSMYYEMPHRDAWHYVRPVKGVCSSVMLTGEPWNREMPLSEEVGELSGLHNDRVHVMLEYFKMKYMHTIIDDNIVEKIRRGDWVMIDEKKMNKDDRGEFGEYIGIKGFVIKNSKEEGLSIRFKNDRVDEFNPKILKKLSKPEE